MDKYVSFYMCGGTRITLLLQICTFCSLNDVDNTGKYRHDRCYQNNNVLEVWHACDQQTHRVTCHGYCIVIRPLIASIVNSQYAGSLDND